MGKFKIGDVVKIRKDWLSLDRNNQYHERWRQVGVIDFVNSIIGAPMTIIDRCMDIYELDMGESMAYYEEWLELVGNGVPEMKSLDHIKYY